MSCCNSKQVNDDVSNKMNHILDSFKDIQLKFNCSYNYVENNNGHVFASIVNNTVNILSTFKCEKNVTIDTRYN